MKLSKPTLYVIVIGGLLAIAGLAWNFYNNSQENAPEAISPPTPAAKAAAKPAAKASATPAAKAAATPAAKAAATPAAKASPAPGAFEFYNAVKKATSAAELTQTAKAKGEWNTVSDNWQQAIDLMKAVPKDNPKYEIAQKKVVEYQNNLNFAKKASELAK